KHSLRWDRDGAYAPAAADYDCRIHTGAKKPTGVLYDRADRHRPGVRIDLVGDIANLAGERPVREGGNVETDWIAHANACDVLLVNLGFHIYSIEVYDFDESCSRIRHLADYHVTGGYYSVDRRCDGNNHMSIGKLCHCRAWRNAVQPQGGFRS